MSTGRHWLWVALLCALLLALLTIAVACDLPIPGDPELVAFAVSLRRDALTLPVWLLAFIGSSAPALLVVIAVNAIELRRARRWTFDRCWPLVAFIGALVCNIVLRIAIGRSRPDVTYIPNLLPELQATFQRFSYPSGHAGAALVAFGCLTVVVRRTHLRWIAAALSMVVVAGVGFGRVYLGVHWPTDVVAGYLLGEVWLAIGFWVRRFGGHY